MSDKSPRTNLLDDLIEYAGQHGLAHASLREIADGVGTSHRMLIHHFGSKDEVLAAVVAEVERRQRDAVREVTSSTSEVDDLWQLWERWADPGLAPYERLFFELYGQALQGKPWATPMLDNAVADWLEPIAKVLGAAGVAADDASARLAIAVTRGLILDLLTTGDRAAVDAAMRRFVQTLEATTAPR